MALRIFELILLGWRMREHKQHVVCCPCLTHIVPIIFRVRRVGESIDDNFIF
jgi:hypothetical protein